MIANYTDKGRIIYGSMKDEANGIYVGYYNDKLGVKIGETERPFLDRWHDISATSRNGFRGLYYYEVGDHGMNTYLIRKVMECLIRRKVSNYAATHGKFYSFQCDSFLCSSEACDKFIQYVNESSENWDKYFARKETEIKNILFDMDTFGVYFKTHRERLGHTLNRLDGCEEDY